MIIKFAKHANRPPTLNCTRDDGTVSWFTASAANGDYFVSHDLLHYAVEATLGYTTAFYGLVADGRDLNDFGSRDGAKDARGYTAEALDAERLVGLIQVLSVDGQPPCYEALLEAWSTSAEPQSSRPLPLTEAQLNDICTAWGRMVKRWQTVESNGSLELAFPKQVVAV